VKNNLFDDKNFLIDEFRRMSEMAMIGSRARDARVAGIGFKSFLVLMSRFDCASRAINPCDRKSLECNFCMITGRSLKQEHR